MTRLALLGLLLNKSMHGYELQSMIEQSKMDQWANILSGSIYYALNKMEEEGLVAAESEERTGARVRKVYGITEAGRAQFKELLLQSLGAYPHSAKSEFTLSLAWLPQLPKEEALGVLRQNLAQLEQQKQFWEAGKRMTGEKDPSPYLAAGYENAMELMEADIRYVTKLITLLQA
ncbi:PadR family transcriptional regulator [Paenibacillus sp. GD4]|uniref:PadR family transcriptional regulator n=1 Tax=Paenibacillus sp. GD4 TaxID=3068890 RepID=UPI0027969105|nr:PadR family transcriptional regulator [Paenibacillus sp. GD4]MDQ1910595.1 PadR family transcriptional regulator [Paenibacillus sp. GD4]